MSIIVYATRLRCGTGAVPFSAAKPASARLPRTSTKRDASPRAKKAERGSAVIPFLHAGASTVRSKSASMIVLATDSDLVATQAPGSPEGVAHSRTSLRRRPPGDSCSIPIGASHDLLPTMISISIPGAYHPNLLACSALGPCKTPQAAALASTLDRQFRLVTLPASRLRSCACKAQGGTIPCMPNESSRRVDKFAASSADVL